MKNTPKIVLSFDLDFTIIDNREGIINSFYYALKKFNLPLIEKDIIEKTIGTPLNETFMKFTNLNPSPLISAFREYYGSKGIYQVKFIPGAKNKLIELKNSFTLGVITSKKQEMAVKLLKFLKIDGYFDYIIGETDNIKSKTAPELINYLLVNYAESKFVVIGDHLCDRELANQLDCPFIGVLTGFSLTEELMNAGTSTGIILKNINDITPDLIYKLLQEWS
jgi:phosphoglycolate phosphatase